MIKLPIEDFKQSLWLSNRTINERRTVHWHCRSFQKLKLHHVYLSMSNRPYTPRYIYVRRMYKNWSAAYNRRFLEFEMLENWHRLRCILIYYLIVIDTRLTSRLYLCIYILNKSEKKTGKNQVRRQNKKK